MSDLSVISDSFEYRGTFSEPPMMLWGQTHLLVRGLYETLRKYNVRLQDIRVLPGGDNAGEGVISIGLSRILVEFRFDSFRILVANVTTPEVETVSRVLVDLALWLQRTADVELVSHAIGYSAHCGFRDSTTSDSFLSRFLTSPYWPGAQAQPSGVIFHYVANRWIPESRLTLTLDHSLLVPKGLWIAAAALRDGRVARIGEAIMTSPAIFGELLDAVQLRIPEVERHA